MIRNNTLILLLVTVLVFISGCSDESKFHDDFQILSESWSEMDTLYFPFEIKDTAKKFDVTIMIRNTSNYPYYNLFVTHFLVDSISTYHKQTSELLLFDPQTGSPEGNRTFLIEKKIGNVFDHEYPLYRKLSFAKTGNYTIKIVQQMRNNQPIEGIKAVGIKLYYHNSGKL